MTIKTGQIWLHANKREYTIIKDEPHAIIAMTDPNVEPEENGYFWFGGAEQFLKEFKFKK